MEPSERVLCLGDDSGIGLLDIIWIAAKRFDDEEYVRHVKLDDKCVESFNLLKESMTLL